MSLRLIGLAALLATAGCGDVDEGGAAIVSTGGTVAVGDVPDPLSNAPTVPALPPPPVSEVATTTTTLPRIEGPIGAVAEGNRLLFVGDSLLASMSPNSSDQLCDVAASFGWAIEVDSRSEAAVDFIEAALEERLNSSGGWDVVAFVFGSEVDPTDDDAVAELRDQLSAAVELVAPRPVVLYTLTEFGEPERGPVNDVIAAVADEYSNVVLVDFAAVGGSADEVLEDEGRRFNEDGRKRFSVQTAATLGQAPGEQDGRCLGAAIDD